MAKLTIRKIRKSELLEAFKLVFASANDLRVRSGRKPWEGEITEVPAPSLHLFETDPDGHWGAFYEGRLVGYCAALMRGRQWYLGYLFVEPKFQLKGVGRKLLERGYEYGKDKAESHALCTFPYNETALALYSSFGMMPTYPIFEMYRKNEKTDNIKPSKLKTEEESSRKSLARIHKLERAIRGYPHQADWEFFARDPKHRIIQFYDGAEWIGYAVLAHNRLIAPAGAVEPRYLPDIIGDVTRLSVESGGEACRIWIGGPNAAAYQRATELGYRIGELVAFLSTRPYSDLYRYCPAHLAIY